MILRPFLFAPTACASYLFGCLTHRQLAVVDPHIDLVNEYQEEARRLGAAIGAVFETHVQADHVSGLPELVEAGATPYLPVRANVDFEHPGSAAEEQYSSIERLLELPDYVLVYPSHYGGSVCGRGLSSNPFSSIGFERRHNGALRHSESSSFAEALLVDLPPVPTNQLEIVDAKRRGVAPTRT
jgi:glyoxylase-like metal-dependent hydrolase (beta-lactamase superfamily II)